MQLNYRKVTLENLINLLHQEIHIQFLVEFVNQILWVKEVVMEDLNQEVKEVVMEDLNQEVRGW